MLSSVYIRIYIYFFLAPSPPPPFCKRFDPLACDPHLWPISSNTDPRFTLHVSRHTTIIPTHLQPSPPVSYSLYIYLYPIPPLLQCQAVRVAWFTRRRVHRHRHPLTVTSTTAHPLRRHQDSIYYNSIYAHAVSVFLPLYILYDFRSSTLCRVDGPMTCTIT